MLSAFGDVRSQARVPRKAAGIRDCVCLRGRCAAASVLIVPRLPLALRLTCRYAQLLWASLMSEQAAVTHSMLRSIFPALSISPGGGSLATKLGIKDPVESEVFADRSRGQLANSRSPEHPSVRSIPPVPPSRLCRGTRGLSSGYKRGVRGGGI